MAMPFEDTLLDHLYTEHFKPAVAMTGFVLRRLDERPEAGSIPNRMRVEILKARFVVAELTTNNDGVYWEAGFAGGLGKPVIYTCQESFKSNLHFDVRQLQHVFWDEKNLAAGGEELKQIIRVTLSGEANLTDPVEGEAK